MNIEVIENINTFTGMIPPGEDLVVFEKGDTESALVLYGFDEIGMFDSDFKNPTYGFTTGNAPTTLGEKGDVALAMETFAELGNGVNLGDVL